MNENDVRKQMTELGLSLFNRGYATGGAGNLSARLPDGGVLLTPTNSSLGRLVPERLSKLDAAGNHVAGDKPTKEAALHLALYDKSPDSGAVVHLHSTYLTALSCLNCLDAENVLRPFTPYYVMRVGKLPLVPYFKPGDPRIATETAARADKAKAFLLANHGPVVLGKNLVEAVNNAEELEETAKLHFILAGRDIRYLSDDEIVELGGKP